MERLHFELCDVHKQPSRHAQEQSGGTPVHGGDVRRGANDALEGVGRESRNGLKNANEFQVCFGKKLIEEIFIFCFLRG